MYIYKKYTSLLSQCRYSVCQLTLTSIYIGWPNLSIDLTDQKIIERLDLTRDNNETGPSREFRALLRRNCSSKYFCRCVCLTLKDWCYWSNETSAPSMAEICASVVSPKREIMKPSARCGKGWGSPSIHMVGQSLLLSGYNQFQTILCLYQWSEKIYLKNFI